MAGSVTTLSLAYLIEISVVLNLTYRELKYARVKEKLQDEISRVREVMSEKEIDKIDSKSIKEKYRRLNDLMEGRTDAAWQEHTILKSFYTGFLKNGKALTVVTWTLGYVLVLLVAATLLAGIEVQHPWLSLWNLICDPVDHFFGEKDIPRVECFWAFGFVTLVASIAVPITLSWLSRLCYVYLFGNGGGKTGRVTGLEQEILGIAMDIRRQVQSQVREIDVKTEEDPESN